MNFQLCRCIIIPQNFQEDTTGWDLEIGPQIAEISQVLQTYPKYVDKSVASILFLRAFITMEYSSEDRDDKML